MSDNPSDSSSAREESSSQSNGKQNEPQANTNTQAEQSASSSSTSTPPTCANCSKPQQSEEKPLKPCSKCQSVLYCDRECTKAHFKVHKKVCAKLAQVYFTNADVKMESSGSRAVKESHRGGLQKWQFDT